MKTWSILRMAAGLTLIALTLPACNSPLRLTQIEAQEFAPEAKSTAVVGQIEAQPTLQVSEGAVELGPAQVTPLRPRSPCSSAELTAPPLTSPAADAVVTGIGTTFSWGNLACEVWGWHFQMCASPDCGAPEFEAFLSPYPNISPGGALEPGTTHYWRAAALLGEPPQGAAGPWSESRRFTVLPACNSAGQLAAPILMNPQEGSTQYAVETADGHLRPMLRWEPSEGCQADDFLVELLLDPESGPVLISHRVGGPENSWRIDQDLRVGATYFWRVASMLGEQVGPFSAPWTFVTIGGTAGQAASVSGRVWNDVCARPPGWEWGDPIPSGCESREGGLSANGVMDAGEAGMAGVTLSVAPGACPSGGAMVEGVQTGADGDYSVSLDPGTYCLWLDSAAGNNAAMLGGGRGTYPACYYDSMEACTLELSDGAVVSGFDFGWERPSQSGALGSIGGAVWRDSDQDGVRGPYESGLAGVEVRLECTGCVGGEPPTVTLTNAQGNYTFGSLPSAAYRVEVDASSPANAASLSTGGWTRPPVPGTSAAIDVVLAGGEARGGIDFGWGYLSVLRPTLYLHSTLQVFQLLPTFSVYRSPTPTSTPRYLVLPSATPRPIHLPPTNTPIVVHPLPTLPPFLPGTPKS